MSTRASVGRCALLGGLGLLTSAVAAALVWHQVSAAGGSAAAQDQAVDVQTISAAAVSECAVPWDHDMVHEICAGVEGATGRRLSAGDPYDRLKTATGPDGTRFGYYGSATWNTDPSWPRRCVKSVLIMVHGAGRDGLDYFCSLAKVVRRIGLNTEETLIIAPQFEYEGSDGKAESGRDHVWWNGSKPWGDWRSGGHSDEKSGWHLSSFRIPDDVLKFLSNESVYPDLQRIWILGHSAGAQMVQRYALVSQLVEHGQSTAQAKEAGIVLREGVEIVYFVANPSSYTYLDEHRWEYDCEAGKTSCTSPGYKLYKPSHGRSNWVVDRRRYTYSTQRRRRQGFEAVSPRSSKRRFVCEEERFNEWPFGLSRTAIEEGNAIPYLRQHWNLTRAVEELYPQRQVVVLVGQLDTCTYDVLPFCYASCWRADDAMSPCSGTAIDMTCPAMLQGPMRNQRGRNFVAHLDRYYGSHRHQFVEVPGVGHQAEKMYTTAVDMVTTRRRRSRHRSSSQEAVAEGAAATGGVIQADTTGGDEISMTFK